MILIGGNRLLYRVSASTALGYGSGGQVYTTTDTMHLRRTTPYIFVISDGPRPHVNLGSSAHENIIIF